MLASILAHEIGHVCGQARPAIHQEIAARRRLQGHRARRPPTRYGSKELAELTGIFEDVLGDIVESLVEKRLRPEIRIRGR